VRNAERVPEHHVCVFEVLGRVCFNPFRKTLGNITGGLRDVSASWVEISILVCDLLVEKSN